MTAIELRHLSKTLGATPVLEDFSLQVAGSGRAVVLGPSGSGKTTLLRLVAGLETPDEGEVLLDGQVASRAGWALPPHARGVGMAFQSPALWPHMTVAANVRFGLAGLPADEIRVRTAALLEALGLGGLEGRHPHQLSGGEARRVALARALAPRPSILLMDEPLTNLNPELKQQALEVILAHLEQYRPTLIFATHDRGEAAAISSQVVQLTKRSEA